MSFTVKGCIIKIDFYFILVLAFCAAAESEDLIYLLLFSSLHEFGHLLMLLLCKGKAEKITLSYYGFALKYADNLTKVKELFIICAGPSINLILYLILNDDINLILFIINMLPIYPLDGGRILKLFSHKASKAVSIVILICIYALSLYLIIFCNSFSMLLIALYLTIYSLNY